jgi:hypothetical protein
MFCHNGVQLGIKFPLKLQFDFYVLLKSSSTRFLHIINFYFIFEKKVNLGINLEMSYDTFHVRNNS